MRYTVPKLKKYVVIDNGFPAYNHLNSNVFNFIDFPEYFAYHFRQTIFVNEYDRNGDFLSPIKFNSVQELIDFIIANGPLTFRDSDLGDDDSDDTTISIHELMLHD